MKRAQFSASARRDLKEIWAYIAVDNEDAADSVIVRIQTEIARIAGTPRIGHRRSDLAGARDYLFWPCGRYLVVYEDDPEAVVVLAVLHGSRDIPAVLRDREEDE